MLAMIRSVGRSASARLRNLSDGLYPSMPTIIRDGIYSLRVFASPREHPPPHVHVEIRGRGIVKVLLGDSRGAVRLWRVKGAVSARDEREAVRLVEQHHRALRAAWERMHRGETTDG